MAHDADAGRTGLGIAIGGLGSLAVSIALVPFRDRIDNTNLALILVFVVVCAAIVGGRWAGAAAAITATMAFDFFLTKPFTSMRIDSADDIETALILLAVGLLVGEVASRGRRARRDQERIATAMARVHRVAELVATGPPFPDVARAVRSELVGLLMLHDCWLELAPFRWPLPTLERGGTVESDEHRWMGRGFALSEHGVQLPVIDAGCEVARLVLIGDPAVAVPVEERVLAVALADQLARAFVSATPDDRVRAAEDLLPPDAE